ncbi:MAG: hypothetical protein LAT65_07025 [Saccharospirillum sp.]|nr:hypothetical protein [Saccharospirillum sp.]
MKLMNLFQRIKQRRDLNSWLKQQRRGRLDLDNLSPHMRKDLGLDNVTYEQPLVWETPAQQQEPAAKPKKERAGPSSA